MKHSESIKDIGAALAKAQGAMGGASKDGQNPHFKSKYASLASVVEAIKKPLADNGIAYYQTPVTNDKDECGIETLLVHASGEWILADPFFLPVSKDDAQGFGSALTYCRRYSLAAVCGVAPEDDDGNAASDAAPAKATFQPMPSGEFAKHKNAIATATDDIGLKKAYTAAYVAAQRIGDADATSRFTDLKDARKEELGLTAPRPKGTVGNLGLLPTNAEMDVPQ